MAPPQPGSAPKTDRNKRSRIAAARRRDARRQIVLRGFVVAAFVAAVVALVVSSRQDRQAGSKAPEETRSFENLSRTHVREPVNYPQTPPVGGNHAPVWQNCGFYGQPIPTEQGVHSLEHGAVWVTYRPDLPAGQVDALRRLTRGQPNVLVSPWPSGLPSAVVASGWGRQLELPDASDPRLDRFLGAFVKGPNTPEPAAPCSGGTAGMP